jgi:hypothetical protein
MNDDGNTATNDTKINNPHNTQTTFTDEDWQMFDTFFNIINSDYSISYLPMKIAVSIPSVIIDTGEIEIVIVCYNKRIVIVNWTTFIDLLERDDEETFSSHLFLKADNVENAVKTIKSLIRIIQHQIVLNYEY